MKKNILIVSTMFCFLTLLTSCNKENKIDFAAKVYKETGGWGYDLIFVDSEFCMANFGYGNYTFNKKTNQIDALFKSIFGSVEYKFSYNKETDELTLLKDGSVYKFSENLTEEDVENLLKFKEKAEAN